MGAMSALPPPAVPYGATAVRPHWPDLPADLRAAIVARLGKQVTWATTATGGFTRGFAAVLDLVDRSRVFVKAARLGDERHLCDWYAHEAAVAAVLPAGVPVARPRWTLTAVGYFVVCFEALSGRPPAYPWEPSVLAATLAAWASTASALHAMAPTAARDLRLPSLGALARADLSWWQEVLYGRSPLPPDATVARDHIRALARLEASFPPMADASRSLTHGDLRVDNILIDDAGEVWFCDWNWLCFGPPWFDTVALLVTAYASGLDADGLARAHPTLAGAPSGAVDAALASLSGYWLTRAAAGPTDASPHLREHQRWSGSAALAWLAARQGWW
jgi:aminoglycoside phosphotransferase (APT) family kinase protein